MSLKQKDKNKEIYEDKKEVQIMDIRSRKNIYKKWD